MTNAARHPVTGNRLGDRTVSALAEMLRVNTGLTSLSFTGNSFGQGGAYVFGDALKENNTLTSVDCSGTQRMLQRVGAQLGLNACQCYVADCKGDIPSLAALAAVESMLSNPECAVTSFDGFPFAKCVAKLGLPAEVARWSDHHVFHYIRESLRLDCLSEKGRLLIDNEYDKDMVEGRSGTTAPATTCYAMPVSHVVQHEQAAWLMPTQAATGPSAVSEQVRRRAHSAPRKPSISVLHTRRVTAHHWPRWRLCMAWSYRLPAHPHAPALGLARCRHTHRLARWRTTTRSSWGRDSVQACLAARILQQVRRSMWSTGEAPHSCRRRRRCTSHRRHRRSVTSRS